MVQNDACKWLRLKHHVYDSELKNVMERFIQKIKDRTQNALTIILVEKRNVIDNTSITVENVCLVPAYGNEEDTIYEIFIDQRWLS